MAVKVLSIKKPAKEVVKKANCRICGAKLSYVSNDVLEYRGTDRCGGPDGREWIVCANCGNEVTIRSW